MSPRKTLLIAALISMAPTALVMAQTAPDPSTSAPSSASSPAQRDATSMPAPEAATTDNSSPAAASSPHQQQATGTHHMASKQSMKDCVAKQQTDNSSLSAADAKKACKAQLKANSG